MAARESSTGAKGRTEHPRLAAVLDGRQIGHVHQDRSGRFRFIYEEDWRHDPMAYAISLSMPLSSAEHAHSAVSAYLWGLLPDNDQTRAQYGRLFGVSAANPVALLAHMGADCAGAIQFAPPDQVSTILSGATVRDQVEWLSEEQIATDLRTVREQGIAGAGRRTTGQFSLAGAQPKIALLHEGERWARPSGRTPTNTILKPPSGAYEGFAENEHFCLELARAMKLGAARSRVMRFGDEIAIVVERYDRAKIGKVHHRIHQEDVCQALGIMPTQKYESDGGPGVPDIIRLLRDRSSQPNEDVDRFVAAIVLNWVIAATNAHAKNYALLHGAGGATRLAPFYDMSSDLTYAADPLHRVKLAMKVGTEYLVNRIGRADWDRLAKSISVPQAELRERITGVLEETRAAVSGVRAAVVDEGLDPRMVNALADRISGRAATCLTMMRA